MAIKIKKKIKQNLQQVLVRQPDTHLPMNEERLQSFWSLQTFNSQARTTANQLKSALLSFKLNIKHMQQLQQVRTNIGLADTLIPSSFIYLIYMAGTGACDSIKIILGYHVNS